MATFNLFGENIYIKDSCIRNSRMNTLSHEASEKAEKDFIAWFDSKNSIDGVMKGYYEIASKLIEEYAFKPLYNTLKTHEIYDVSEDAYIRECISLEKVDDAFSYIESELEEIIDDRNEMMQYRAIRKQSRGRWTGGGFGVSGAIKGAAKAGALNATSGMAHSVVNTIGNVGSTIAAAAKKSALYNNETRETLCTGIYMEIVQIYDNHKRLINQYIDRYYENSFEWEKAITLFENAKKIPEKREQLLIEAVQKYPDEKILSYIFINYKEERSNVYDIGKNFGIDFSKYIEESFAAAYTEEIKADEHKVAELKAEILATMKEYGMTSSITLKKLDFDELTRIAIKYKSVEATDVELSLKQFEEYDASQYSKKNVVKQQGVWELASKYDVVYSKEEVESILKRYYGTNAQKNEDAALVAKKQIVTIMKKLGVESSDTFDKLEKDCIARICEGVESSDENTCNEMREHVETYDALEKNKKEYLKAIQKRIEDIWAKEDGEIFDNLYLNTDLFNKDEVNKAIEFVNEKGRTNDAKKYIKALKMCSKRNIKKARKYQKKSTKISNRIAIVLLIICVALFGAEGSIQPEVYEYLSALAALLLICSLFIIIRNWLLKRKWKVLTIGGTQVHDAVNITKSMNGKNKKK